MTSPDTLTIAEACEKLGRSRWTVKRLIRSKQLTARKIGQARNGRVLVDAASVEAYLQGRPIAETDESTAAG